MNDFEAKEWIAERRRAFWAANESTARRLLTKMFADVAGDRDRWRLLRFSSVDAAVAWAAGRWSEEELDPRVLGFPEGAVAMGLWVFGYDRLWEILRLADLQKRAQAEDEPERELGRSRREHVGRAADVAGVAIGAEEAEQAAEFDGTDVCDDPAAAEARIEHLVHELVVTLEELGRRTHRQQEILWLLHHARLRRALAQIDEAEPLEARRPEPLPQSISDLARPARSKAGCLAAFRYFVLFDRLAPSRTLEGRAFVLTHLTNFEKPPWPTWPRDRWDQVPKRVVADRLSDQESRRVTSTEAAEGARREMARLAGLLIKRGRSLTVEEPDGPGGRVALYLRILLVEDSISTTLRDEYARKSGDTATPPTAPTIDAFRAEAAVARAALATARRAS